MAAFYFGRGRLSRRAFVLIAAGLLLAAILALRFFVARPDEGVMVLCVIPIALVATEFGLVGGLAMAALSLGLVVVWTSTTGTDLGVWGYASRATSFLLVGGVFGRVVTRRRALEEHHTRWFQTSRDLSCTAGFDGYFKSLNPAWEKSFGFSIKELKSRPFLDFIHPDDRQATLDRRVLLANAGAEPTTFTNRYQAKDGSYRWLEWSTSANQAEQLIYASARDITDRKLAEDALREAEERFRTAFDSAPIGMALVDLDGNWFQVNEALCSLTGYPEDILLNMGFREITHPEDLPSDEEHARKLSAGEINTYRLEKRFIHADGYPVWVSFSASLVNLPHGDPLYLITQVEDISERKQLVEELNHLAQHDSLTGLFNRGRFEEELVRHFAHVRRYGSRGAVLVFDLDKFKGINDTHGHAAGDEILRTVGNVLKENLRSTDMAARFGGDEFAIILPETDANGATQVADKLLEAIRDHLAGPDQGVALRASMGIALYDAHSGENKEDDLIVAADKAMYEAKRAGGDRYVVRSTPLAPLGR